MNIVFAVAASYIRHMDYALLDNRALIALSGQDVGAFLQGIITQDITTPAVGNACYAALLNPQGKFLHDFLLIPQDNETIWLDVHSDRVDDLLAKLKVYRLRSKVQMERLPDHFGVITFWGGNGPGIIDPRLPQLGTRLYGDREEGRRQAETIAKAGDYEAHRIHLAVPDGALDMVIEKSLIMEYGFEDLHGVNFSKGCYVGQEVTARMKHRAQLRKHICKVVSEEELPIQDTAIMMGSKEVGTLLSVSGSAGLAIAKIEAVIEPHETLICGDVQVTLHWPDWLHHIPTLPQ